MESAHNEHEIKSTERAKPVSQQDFVNRQFIIYWIVGHMLVMALADWIGNYLVLQSFPIYDKIPGDMLPPLIAMAMGMLLGGMVGLLQWALLKPMGISRDWIFISMFTIGIYEFLITYATHYFDKEDKMVMDPYLLIFITTGVYLLAGLSAGINQSKILLKKRKKGPSWKWGSTFSWGLFALIGSFIAVYFSIESGFLTNLAGGVGMGFLSFFYINKIIRSDP